MKTKNVCILVQCDFEAEDKHFASVIGSENGSVIKATSGQSIFIEVVSWEVWKNVERTFTRIILCRTL